MLVNLLQTTTVLSLMVTLTEPRSFYSVERNPYQEVFLSQLPDYLSLIEFDTQEECVRAMCSPRRSRGLDHWFTFSTHGDTLSVTMSDASPDSPIEYTAFNELRNALKSGSHVITDGQNNAIGVSEDPERGDNNNRIENPSDADTIRSSSEHEPHQPPEYGTQGYGLDELPAYSGWYRAGGFSLGGGYGGVLGAGFSYSSSDDDNQKPPVAGKPLKPSIPSSETNVCCGTVESYFINSTLTDIGGTTRTIAQMKHIGTYQIIRHGFCGKRGLCPGICDQVYVVLPLAIYPNDPGQTVTYRYFRIPGYCSCKVPADGKFK